MCQGVKEAGQMNELEEPLARLARNRLGGLGVADVARMSAGATQEIWRFSLIEEGDRTPLILRRAPGGVPDTATPQRSHCRP